MRANQHCPRSSETSFTDLISVKGSTELETSHNWETRADFQAVLSHRKTFDFLTGKKHF